MPSSNSLHYMRRVSNNSLETSNRIEVTPLRKGMNHVIDKTNKALRFHKLASVMCISWKGGVGGIFSAGSRLTGSL